MHLTWLGHSAFHLHAGGVDVLIDPFFTGNPTFPEGYEAKLSKVDVVAITHGHGDHLGDAERLVKQHRATLVAIYEVCQYLGARGVDNMEPMNIGGTITTHGLTISMVNAQHSAAVIDDGTPVTMGDPAGLVIRTAERTVYHAGDTGLFSDMALIQRLYRPDVGLLPIGDRLTMGPEHAAIACNEFLDLEVAVPIHHGTWPLLPGDPTTFRERVTGTRVDLPKPGETLEL